MILTSATGSPTGAGRAEMAADCMGGPVGGGGPAVLRCAEEVRPAQRVGSGARVEPGVEVLYAVPGGDQVDPLSVRAGPDGGVEPAEQAAEGDCFIGCHLGEVGVVTP